METSLLRGMLLASAFGQLLPVPDASVAGLTPAKPNLAGSSRSVLLAQEPMLLAENNTRRVLSVTVSTRVATGVDVIFSKSQTFGEGQRMLITLSGNNLHQGFILLPDEQLYAAQGLPKILQNATQRLSVVEARL